jgi:hypothetical protein
MGTGAQLLRDPAERLGQLARGRRRLVGRLPATAPTLPRDRGSPTGERSDRPEREQPGREPDDGRRRRG